MSEWIKITDKIPPCDDDNELPYCLAYHTIYGVGVAWFYVHNEGYVSDIEEDFKDKYLCSCEFVKSKKDADWSIDSDNDIDIMYKGDILGNLGTVTHWMPLPENPISKDC